MKTKPNRRQFLSGGAKALAALSVLPSIPAWALPLSPLPSNPDGERFFLMIRVQPAAGGLDVTLGLDPWILPDRPLATDLFIEYRHDEVLQAGGLFLGPAATPLAPYATDLSILNGVFMSEFDNGHPAGIGYMTTANGQGNAADLPVEIGLSSRLGEYGVFTSDSLQLANRLAPFIRTSDVLNARNNVDPAKVLDGAVQGAGRTPLEDAIGSIIRSQDITAELNRRILAFETSGAKLEDMHAVAAGFISGAARQAKLDLTINGNVDSHASHEGTHLAAQKSAFTKVAEIFALFKSISYGTQGKSLFDHTLFMVISDFARTPALNGSKGKDHNPLTNSVLLGGAGIQRGKVINKSLLIEAKKSKTGSSYHMASPFNFTTGLPAPDRNGAEFIFPENLAVTVAQAYGADLALFGSVPKGTKPIPGLV